jgi:signal transduction histidine kinase
VPLVDLAAAAALIVLAEATTFTLHRDAPRAAAAVIALAMTAPLAWRRVSPLAVLGATLAAMTVLGAVDRTIDPLYVLLATLLATYSVGAHAPRRIGVAALAFTVAALFVGLALNPERHETGDYLFVAVLYVGAWGLGAALRERSARVAQLEWHTELLEREQEQKARAAVLEERARIARELHDVVAHSVSVMLVQTGVVRRRLAERPEEAGLLAEVEDAGRQALAEMRRLLGLLRAEDDEPALAPQPGLANLPALVEQLRETGLNVDLSVEGSVRPVAAGLDLAAYRIVQEALTNVLKHAGGAPACVAVRWRDRELELEVADEGQRSTHSGGQGHGLVGMRERARLYGGSLDAAPRPEGGFRVYAVLPLDGLAL